MQQKKNGYHKLIKVIVVPSKFIYALIKGILKTIFLDLFRNIKKEIIYTFNEVERKKIKTELETEKLVDLINERLKRIERLIYSMFNDPEYIKRDKGKTDLKELTKEVDRKN